MTAPARMGVWGCPPFNCGFAGG